MIWSLLTVAWLIAGCVAATFSLYLVALSVAAIFYSACRVLESPRTRLVVLIPAHDESTQIARCVESLRMQKYPSALYEIVVIADNCTDDTAAVAAAAGADRVMTRTAPASRGKGQALRWALDQILAWKTPPAAVVFVDADSSADPELLAALARRFENGSRAVQGMYVLSNEGPFESALTRIAFMLVNRVRPAGRTVLRLPAAYLAGNGMLLAARTLREIPWTAFTSTEDLEYSLMLYMAGEQIAYAGDAMLVAPPAPSAHAAEHQQLRWHGGKAHLARVWVPRLVIRGVRERRPSLLVVAFELSLPPLALLAMAVVAGALTDLLLAATGLIPAWSLAPWVLALSAVPISVLIGLRAAGAPRSDYQALIRAPLYVVRMARRAHRVLSFRGETWVRTARDAPTE